MATYDPIPTNAGDIFLEIEMMTTRGARAEMACITFFRVIEMLRLARCWNLLLSELPIRQFIERRLKNPGEQIPYNEAY